MRGRKPKPLAIHANNGNPSRIDLDARREAEPKAATGAPPRPQWLNPTAAVSWDYLIGHLDIMGTLSQSDQQAIAMICQAYGIYADAMAEVNAHGAVVTIAGQPQPNPYLSVANKQATILMKMLPEFGLTPSARSRIAIKRTETAEAGSDILAFIGKKSA